MRHTAEEVRERAAEDMAAHVSADMLLAYADLLEQMESADADLPEGVWPDELMIRDTALHDDMGGQGQRIYTTAGAGYPKVKYVRANAATSADAEDAARWRYLLRNRFVLGNGTCLIDAHCTAQDAELLDAIDEARAEEAEVADIEQQCKQARPHDELICELLDSRRPKTEREHAAAREIERLRDFVGCLGCDGG